MPLVSVLHSLALFRQGMEVLCVPPVWYVSWASSRSCVDPVVRARVRPARQRGARHSLAGPLALACEATSACQGSRHFPGFACLILMTVHGMYRTAQCVGVATNMPLGLGSIPAALVMCNCAHYTLLTV
jgi:hypothetical protein